MSFAELSPESQSAIVDVVMGIKPPALTEPQRAEIIAWAEDPRNFTESADGYVESVCPTTGRRSRYKQNGDGTIVMPFGTPGSVCSVCNGGLGNDCACSCKHL